MVSPGEIKNILVIEDNVFMGQALKSVFVREALETSPAVTVEHAPSEEVAYTLLAKLVEQGVDPRSILVLLDGNLSVEESNGVSGQKVAQKIRETIPGAAIIGISGSEQDYVDAYLGKNELTKRVRHEGSLITSLINFLSEEAPEV